MEVVSVYKWFEAVWWPDGGCLIDCLVDTSDTSLKSGSYLHEKDGTLKIIALHDSLELPQFSNHMILGKVIRRDCPLSAIAQP
ncbi:MAG: hypothetical protein AB7I18_10310 [Candidatus Berkiella sp.]